MIVWGGTAGSRLDTGGRYDPFGDSWLATSTGPNLPEARAGHTAVWTGSEMIVWGGDDSGFLVSGGRYDPATDSWSATSTGMNVPAGRFSHTAVWTGTEMIVWGGNESGRSSKTGGRYCAAACTSPATWYQDHDGDGHGNSSVPQSACTQPTGFAAVAGDCDDISASAWSAPVEVANFKLSGAATTGLTWNGQSTVVGPGVTYDVAQGSIGTWPVGSGSEVCLRQGIAATAIIDATLPAARSGYWYLVRGHDVCAAGTYGNRSNGTPRATSACP
jgi:hypothetical protein